MGSYGSWFEEHPPQRPPRRTLLIAHQTSLREGCLSVYVAPLWMPAQIILLAQFCEVIEGVIGQQFLDKVADGFGFPAATPADVEDDLSHLSYDWYRKSGSYTANSWLHPVLRLYISNDDGTQRGYLVYERAYNPAPAPVPTDEWITDSIGDNTNLWTTGTLPLAFTTGYSLSWWKANYGLGQFKVYAISAGIGSGWGTFEGAVDNISYQFGSGPRITSNFEVVPEPTTMALFGLGLAAVGGLARRKRA